MVRKEVERGKWDEVLSQIDELKLVTICRNLVKFQAI